MFARIVFLSVRSVRRCVSPFGPCHFPIAFKKAINLRCIFWIDSVWCISVYNCLPSLLWPPSTYSYSSLSFEHFLKTKFLFSTNITSMITYLIIFLLQFIIYYLWYETYTRRNLSRIFFFHLNLPTQTKFAKHEINLPEWDFRKIFFISQLLWIVHFHSHTARHLSHHLQPQIKRLYLCLCIDILQNSK